MSITSNCKRKKIKWNGRIHKSI